MRLLLRWDSVLDGFTAAYRGYSVMVWQEDGEWHAEIAWGFGGLIGYRTLAETFTSYARAANAAVDLVDNLTTKEVRHGTVG